MRLPEELAEQAEAVARGQRHEHQCNDRALPYGGDRRVRADKEFTTRATAAPQARQGTAGPACQVTRYLTLAEYLWLAEQVTGITAGVWRCPVGWGLRPNRVIYDTDTPPHKSHGRP